MGLQIVQMRLMLGMFSNVNDVPPREPSLQASSSPVPGKIYGSLYTKGTNLFLKLI